MAVRDSRLVLRVPHRDRDVAYPIAVDPVIDDYAWWGAEELEGWFTQQGPPDTFWFGVADGLYIGMDWGFSYPHTALGDWYWVSPGDAYISTAEFYDARNDSFALESFAVQNCISEGVFSLTRWAWEPGSWHVPGTAFGGSTPWTTCNPDAGGHVKVHNLSTVSPGNMFIFRHWAWGAGMRESQASLAAVRLWLGDFSAPTVPQAVAQPRWIHPTPHEPNILIGADAQDAGLGLSSMTLSGAGATQTQSFGCAGTAYNPCPGVGGNDFLVNALGWADGLYRPNVRATDILGQVSAPREVPIGVDRQRPAAPQLTGDLYDRRGTALSHGEYTLNVSAQDGNSAGPDSARQSGITDLEIYLGKPGNPSSFDRVHHKKVDCATDSCPLTTNWTLKTQDEAGGPTSVRVVATDGAGHRSEAATFDVTLPESGELVTPKDAARTARRLGLQAKAHATDYTTAKFQYRRSTSGIWGVWTDIPASALTRQGGPVGAAQQPLGGDRKSPLLVWDVPATVAPVFVGPEFEPVQLQVRAVFAGGTGGSSRAHDVTLDQDTPSTSASQAIGPGQVDLLSGNFSYTASDVEIASFGQALTVTRTFNSRVRSNASIGPFGVRSWTLGVDIAGASSYIGVREASDGSGNVELLLSDGSKVWFERRASGFVSEPGFEDLTLYEKAPAEAGSGCGGEVYKLADIDGNVTMFERHGGEWVVCKVRQPGQSDRANTSRFLYENGPDNKPRIKKVAAPAPAGAACLSAITAGCRVVEFIYGTTGATAGRLTTVKFHSGETPAGGEAVVQYEYGADGKLSAAYDPRISPALRETYTYTATDGHRLDTITPPGEAAWKLFYQALPAGDPSPGRLSAVERPAGGARTSVFYGVPVTGASARYEMGAAVVAAWGQGEPPTDATAVVPATEASPSASSAKATLFYLDHAGRLVNTVAPRPGNTRTSFEASTTEYDEHDNVVRELSPSNRRRALAMGGDPATTAARARLYDTQRTYSADGLELQKELGPQHQITLPADGTAQARAHTQVSYGCNDQEPKAHLPTRTETGAQLSDQSIVDVRVTTTEYACALRQPTKTVTDPSGLNLARTIQYDVESGLPVESRMPSNPNPSDPGDASTTRTLYYSDGAHPTDSACANRPEWWNLPCKTKPAAQPGTAGFPDLPVSTFEYNRYQQVTLEKETVGATERKTTTTYDVAGRKHTESITATGPSGGSGPSPGLVAAFGFDEGSGSGVADGSGSGNSGSVSGASWSSAGKFGKALSFDGTDDKVTVPDSNSLDLASGMTLEAWVKPAALGSDWRTVLFKEQTDTLAYSLYAHNGSGPSGHVYVGGDQSASGGSALPTDAWSHLALTYDGSNLRVFVNGSQVASRAQSGSITASNGALRIGGNDVWGEWFNGLIDEVRIYNRALTAGEIQTDKDTPVSDLGSGGGAITDTYEYRYDPAGRLTKVADDEGDAGCTTRVYAYDANSNRLARTTRAPTSSGACDSTGSGQAQNSTYDAADRLTSAGVEYDSYGRMTRVPASHSGGGSLQTTYYVNDMVRSQTQASATNAWLLDPTQVRHRATVPSGNEQEVLHYADASDAPAWTVQMSNGTPSRWSRNVDGIDGDLAAIHDSQAGTEVQLANLHGDVIATAASDPAAIRPVDRFEADEFGTPAQVPAARYGWLGGEHRRSGLPSGALQMGRRSYIPSMGRFTSVDPVTGGAANAYDYTRQDPVNGLDLNGTDSRACQGSTGIPWQGTDPATGLFHITWRAEIHCNLRRRRNGSVTAWTNIHWRINNGRDHIFHGGSRTCRLPTCEVSGAFFKNPLLVSDAARPSPSRAT